MRVQIIKKRHDNFDINLDKETISHVNSLDNGGAIVIDGTYTRLNFLPPIKPLGMDEHLNNFDEDRVGKENKVKILKNKRKKALANKRKMSKF